jgi:hypothetical protein
MADKNKIHCWRTMVNWTDTYHDFKCWYLTRSWFGRRRADDATIAMHNWTTSKRMCIYTHARKACSGRPVI